MTTQTPGKSHRLNRDLKASKLKSKKAQLENLFRKQERLAKEIQVLKSSIAKDSKQIAKESSTFNESLKQLKKVDSKEEKENLQFVLESLSLPSEQDLSELNPEKAKCLISLESFLDPKSSEDIKDLKVRLSQVQKEFQALSSILDEILGLLLKFE